MHDHVAGCACGPEVPEVPAEEVEARRIMQVTAGQCGFTVEDLTGPWRSPGLVFARHIAMYLCRERTSLSFPQVGRLFDRHHTSVMHGVTRIADDVIAQRNPAHAGVARVRTALDA